MRITDNDTYVLDNINKPKDLETSHDNNEFKLVSSVKKNKKPKIKLLTHLNSNNNPSDSDNSVNQNFKLATKNSEKPKISYENVTKHDKRLYVHKFLNYNFHKINRYLSVEEYELDNETSDSDCDYDIYDYY